ncbi:hypothetical protein RMATCC62417_09556 [Rhizopus microsporus]|nr:hypothetical protein RMATCC62417_09556 [Rhizopus microsporus]
MEELVGLLNGYLAIIEGSNFKAKVADWLAKDDRFGRSEMCRVGATTVRMRGLWMLKEEHRPGCCRKSKCNISQEQQAKLIQRMTEILKVRYLCEKMYVSPIFSTISPLLERDFSNNTATVLDKIKYKDGHFQELLDFVILAKSSSVNIRLVTFDYAGLTISFQTKQHCFQKIRLRFLKMRN